MPTLDVAAHSLGISEKTLRKWMRRLEIAPTRHPQDWRFRTLTDEEVQRIANERAQMPTVAHKANMPPALLRAESDRASPLPDTFPITTIKTRRQQALSASLSLPDGMMSKTDAASLHGVKETTLRTWCREGKIETAAGEYGGEGGRWKVRDPLTRKGLAQLYEFASPRSDFIPCSSCPHTIDAADASSE